MARPSLLLRWANAVTGSFPGRLEPNDGKKDVGFDDGEAPPAGEHNWIFGLAGDWIQYLDEQITRLLPAALLNVSNVFTAGPIEVNVADALIAALVTRTTADDDANAGNKWKSELAFHIGNTGAYVLAYAGTKAGPGQFIIALNAVWDTATQTWSQDDASSESLALIFLTGSGLFVSRKAAGSAAWSSWPAGAGDLTVGGNLTVYGSLGLTAVGPVLASNVAYTSRIARVDVLAPSDAQVANGSVAYVAGRLVTVGADTVLTWQIRVPPGGTLGVCTVLFDQAGAAYAVVQALRSYGADFATPTAPTVGVVDSQISSTSTGVKSRSVDFGGLLSAQGESYEVSWHSQEAGDKIFGLEVHWAEAAPRTTV